ncbi:ROK family protein [Microbacterium sp. PRC9]|uniref:ROK family protein n=1 Tax=Microbacterium sp. PRC9 TaxID=2962591 RepID=UPI0028825A45|nr:ROK family protein [Microbacterium sp. PRC9]MDT0144558.1 ROK family protein [Microbacterium sp. PRC9]
MIASGSAETRADLVRETGLARSTVTTGLNALQRIGLLAIDGHLQQIGRGRPGERISIAPGFGVIVSVEIDRPFTRVALYDYGQAEVASSVIPATLADDPRHVVDEIAKVVRSAIDTIPHAPSLRFATVGVSAPVDVNRGMVVGPPFMEGWDGFALERELRGVLGCPVILRNESDLRALGEARSLPPSETPLVYVRLEQGVGAGFTDGAAEIFSGVDGAAGEISHMRSTVQEGRPCSCGGTDHVSTHGSVAAMIERWQALDPARSEDGEAEFFRALRLRDLDATRIATDAARVLGAALTEILLVLNPARIIVGGTILEASDAILATIRGVIYETGLPLATRNLTIAASVLGESAGLRGGLILALEESLSAESLAGVEAASAAHLV